MGQSIIADTNVLINNFEILNEENLIIPYRVLEELDNLKTNKEIGYKVREVVRKMINDDIECREFDKINDKTSTDNALIRIGLKNNIKIITQDYLMYKKGQAKGVNIELYEPQRDIYEGVIEGDEYRLDKQKIDRLYDNGRLRVKRTMNENQFLDNDKIITRYKEGYLYKVDWNKDINGLSKPTRRQLMALDVLYDEKVKLVNIFGEQGVGKTTCALNSAVDQVMSGRYDRLLISRPKKSRNVDEGFAALPGELSEKYAPYNAPFYDNIYTQTALNFEIIPLSSIQGRSLDGAIWIITEAQDISPNDMELIVGRCGRNTKLVLEGDLNQHSDNRLNKYNNGLTHVINTLKESKLTATIKLDENKRSGLSKLSMKL